MHDNPDDEALVGLYRRGGESTRLATGVGVVELVRTRALLRRRLEPSRRILDIGGAAGVHAAWLIEDGHAVEIVDLVPDHVERARERGLRAEVGDARALTYDDASFDVVLLLGPLYHLATAEDRASALGEAHRILRPGGLLAAAAVSRLSVAMDQVRRGRGDDPGARDAIRRIATVGRDDTGFGAGLFYFHTPRELRTELVVAGFDDLAIHGVEGPGWPVLPDDAEADDPLVHRVVEIAELADSEPASVAASAHLLAFGRRAAAPAGPPP